ncbi:MAG: DUF1385 domain-containing protein [Lachnospiraceae bacterium]|nr:DUF1385 domain-containing protein [Lachnospiraceae bacterium]
MKASGIGGQAVMEGVMMKNGDQYAVAVRKNDEEIVVEKKEHVSLTKRVKFFGLPVIRGVIIFGESLSVGVKTLTYSARIFEEETDDPSLKKEKTPKEKTKEDAVMAGSVVLSVIIAVALFMMLPYFASRLLATVIDSEFLLALCEGVIRVTLFVIYIAAISLMKDIKRVFMYHGAEHKSINCVENGLPLTVENVRSQSREHKRCGTSFMLYVMVISVLFFMFIRFDHAWLRIVARLALIPVIAGISYEFIRLAGRTENPVIAALSKPGLLLQKLTTREPDDSMIEVAITSVEAVFDWKEFLEKFDKDEAVETSEKESTADTAAEAVEKTQDRPLKGKSRKNRHKKAAEEVIEAEVVANVRIGGITDPIEDLDDDFDIIPEAYSSEPGETSAESGRETAGDEKPADDEKLADSGDEAESAEDKEEPAGPVEDKPEEPAGPVEDKPEESGEPGEEKKEEPAEDKKEEPAEDKKEDVDNLGYFRGKRSTGQKNTGMDSTPEPTNGVNHRAPVEIEKRAAIVEEDEDDEVLKKLDRYFVNKNKKDSTQSDV